MSRSINGCWMVVYMCHSRQKAADAERLLTQEGFLVRSRALERSTDDGTYEIHALESEAKEARSFILEKGL